MTDCVISASGLTKEYADGRRRHRVLHGLQLSIGAGEITTITGPSGSGKTTLLRVLGGLSTPNAGRVVLQGQDLYAMADRQRSRFRNRHVGFIFQDYRLLPNYNAIDNVMMPLVISGASRKQQRHRASRALRMVGLSTMEDQRVDRLSGGQQQRVGIARALAMSPPVLVADEPTGNLDQAAGAGIINLFHRLRRHEGISVVLVTHDDEVATQGDHLVRIVDGRVVEDSRALH